MNPNDDRQLAVPQRHPPQPLRTDRAAAVDMIRGQIDQIYGADETESVQSTPQTTADPVAHPTAHETTSSAATDHSHLAQVDTAHWQNYHTAWQTYYQKYYERYYLSQLFAQRKQQQEAAAQQATRTPTPVADDSSTFGPVPEDKAVADIKADLLSHIETVGKRARASRHFWPVVCAVTVMLLFAFAQYNRLVIATAKAYISPGAIEAQNIIVDPSMVTAVDPAPKVVIPKINVDAPAVYGLPNLQENTVQKGLEGGVVHYAFRGASAVPGEKGNAVFLGHSSNDVFDAGDYKFVFVQLERMQKGDTFYLHYNGTRYTYRVTETKTIKPSQISDLVLGNDRPLATLITCTPIGTATNRFIVIGEQISPDPNAAPQSTESQDEPTRVTDGQSPSLFERLWPF